MDQPTMLRPDDAAARFSVSKRTLGRRCHECRFLALDADAEDWRRWAEKLEFMTLGAKR